MDIEGAVRAIIKKARVAAGLVKETKDTWAVYELARCAISQLVGSESVTGVKDPVLYNKAIDDLEAAMKDQPGGG